MPASLRTRSPAPVALGLVLAALAAPLGACGEDGASGEASGPPRVVATTGVLADVVAAVAGPDAEVSQLVPDGASPHSYAPSAREQQQLVDADLLVYFHPALEEALPLDAAPERFELAAHTDGGSPDPHVWLDPTAVAAALPALAAVLGEVDPEHASGYERRAEAYADELAALDRELAATVERIPAANRRLVTSHDLLGRYADRYGFEVVGAPFGSSPEAEASAGDVAGLIADVEAAGVPAVFAQRGDDPEVLRLIAAEAGVEVVDDLLFESLDDRADTYLEMMRFSTDRIAAALSG